MTVESPYQLVLQRLQSRRLVGSTNPDSTSARCPAHDDQRPSLSVTDAGDKVLIKCHTGCDTEDVLEALDLGWSDLFDEGAGGSSARGLRSRRRTATLQKATEYVYRDSEDEPVLKVIRSASKRFHVQHWNGSSWVMGKGPVTPPLYNLSYVRLQKSIRAPILVVEGEKDADRSTDERLPATTNPFGAGKWKSVDSSPLDGADVVVVADNDIAGRRHAAEVVGSLLGRARRVRLLDLAGLVPKRGDLSDWYDMGGTKDQLETLIDALPDLHGIPSVSNGASRFGSASPIASEGNLELYRAGDLFPWADKPPKWRVKGLLVEGTYGVVAGSKKTLKSTMFSAELAVAVSSGTNWLDAPGFEVETPCSAVVLINEGIRPYLRNVRRIAERKEMQDAGGIYVVEAQGSKFGDSDLEAMIRTAVEESGAGLFIFDAAYGFITGDTEASSLFAMGEQLGWLQQICSQLDVDLLVVHHLKKNQRGGKPDLDDVAWAGFPEWSDSWFLLTHASPPDAANGLFRIGLTAGSRQGYEFLYEIHGDTGGFDLETLGPTRPANWRVTTVTPEEAANWGTKRKSKSRGSEGILSLIDASPFQLTESQIAEILPGSDKNHVKNIKRMLDDGTLQKRKLKRQEGTTSRTRELIGRPDQETPELIININPP